MNTTAQEWKANVWKYKTAYAILSQATFASAFNMVYNGYWNSCKLHILVNAIADKYHMTATPSWVRPVTRPIRSFTPCCLTSNSKLTKFYTTRQCIDYRTKNYSRCCVGLMYVMGSWYTLVWLAHKSFIRRYGRQHVSVQFSCQPITFDCHSRDNQSTCPSRSKPSPPDDVSAAVRTPISLRALHYHQLV